MTNAHAKVGLDTIRTKLAEVGIEAGLSGSPNTNSKRFTVSKGSRDLPAQTDRIYSGTTTNQRFALSIRNNGIAEYPNGGR